MLTLLALVACSGPATAPAQPTITGSSPAPELGLVINQELRVEDVVAGGAAMASGIQPGDVLVALEGQPLANPDKLRPDMPPEIWSSQNGRVVRSFGLRLPGLSKLDGGKVFETAVRPLGVVFVLEGLEAETRLGD